MALMPSNSASWIGYPNTPSTGGTWIATTSTYTTPCADLYLVDCLHCGEKFVTKSRKTMACIESMETCWDVECPKCNQEIRLCLHECKHDCAHALDCILVGILDKVLEKGVKLEFEKGAEVLPYASPGGSYQWNPPPVYGFPNWGGDSGNTTYIPTPTTVTNPGKTNWNTGSSSSSSDAVTISFVDKVRKALALKMDNQKE